VGTGSLAAAAVPTSAAANFPPRGCHVRVRHQRLAATLFGSHTFWCCTLNVYFGLDKFGMCDMVLGMETKISVLHSVKFDRPLKVQVRVVPFEAKIFFQDGIGCILTESVQGEIRYEYVGQRVTANLTSTPPISCSQLVIDQCLQNVVQEYKKGLAI